jgi:outer membrane protein assembly factor BamA
MGQDYTERDFQRLLDFNVRPLYEELGRLTVAFPSVRMADSGDAAVAVTAGIDEGPVWQLGKVVLTGDALPLADMYDAARFAYGAPANWKQFMASIHQMEQVLRRDGYITVSSKPLRSFHEPTLVVDVNVEVRKGA